MDIPDKGTWREVREEMSAELGYQCDHRTPDGDADKLVSYFKLLFVSMSSRF